MKTIFLSILVSAFAFVNANAAIAAGKKEKVTIQTSAQCDACFTRITKSLTSIDGVKSVRFNDAKQAIVIYDSAKTNPDVFRTTINEAGYDADATAANTEVYSKLPQCCQKGGHD